VAVSVPSKSKTTPFSLGLVTFVAPIFLRVVLKGMSAHSRQDGMDTLGVPSSKLSSRARLQNGVSRQKIAKPRFRILSFQKISKKPNAQGDSVCKVRFPKHFCEAVAL